MKNPTIQSVCISAIVGILWLFQSGVAEAQAAQPMVLSGGGNVYNVSGVNHAFTLGQPFFNTLSDGGGTMTQGFHQPWQISSCLGDFTGDGIVNTGDLLLLMAGYGCTFSCTVDLNEDDVVNVGDILLFMALFGTSCS